MEKEPIKFIFTGDGFHLRFAEYWSIRKDEKFKEKIEYLIYKRECWIPETDNTYRTINHWMNLWLIDDTREGTNKWRKFNLMDLVWISIITKLRGFGFSNEKILETKKALFGKQWEASIVVEYYIAAAMFNHKEVSCVVFNDWYSALLDELDLNLAKILIKWYDYIVISITSIIESVTKKTIGRNDPTLVALSKKEIELLRKTMSEGDAEVKTKIKDWEMKEFNISHPKRIHITDIKNTNISSLIKSNPNAKIIISTNDNAKTTGIVVEKSV